MTDDVTLNIPTARLVVRMEDVKQVLQQAPKIAYFWIRDFLGRSMGSHRAEWLAQKSTRFGRGGAGIKVSQVNQSKRSDPAPREVLYRVQPEAKRMPTPQAAGAGLDAMVAEAAHSDIVLPTHEFGATIKNRKGSGMFIPVRTRPGDFTKWREKNRQRKLLFAPSKRGDGKTLVYEMIRRGARGRPRKGEPRQGTTKLRLRFIIAKEVHMKRTLQFYEVWDRMTPKRDRFWSEAATKMQRDLQTRNPRDF